MLLHFDMLAEKYRIKKECANQYHMKRKTRWLILTPYKHQNFGVAVLIYSQSIL